MSRKILIILVLVGILAVVIPIVKAPFATLEFHDVEAFDQVVDPNTVEPGELVDIEVNVRNNGGFIESFDVTCYYDTVEVGTIGVVDLAPSEIRLLTFTLDTSALPVNTYLVTVLADSGEIITEINESNNLCTAQASLFVVPEIPLIGTAGATLAMFAGLAIHMKRKRLK